MYLFYMPKSIRDYLPCRVKQKKTMVQARVNTPIVSQVKTIMRDEDLSWADVVTACLSHFVDDRNGALTHERARGK